MPMHTGGGPAAALAGHIIRSLREGGHTAYLVGGCVRDLLLDRPVKDFDVATSATPDQVLSIFPEADRIGAHFGVVLVRRGSAAVEVATFRSDHGYGDGRHPDRVTYETDPRQDALRRDFTINAMMMNPDSGAILDFAGGRADLEARIIRAVGDPLERFGEDHLRMLRAVRFAARLDFEIDAETMRAIEALAPRIRSISAERVREELERIFTEGGVRRGVELLDASGLLGEILPEVARPLSPARLASLAAMQPPRATLALAVLLEHSAADPAAALERLRFSTATIRRVSDLLAVGPRLAELPAMGLAAQKRLIRTEGFDEHLEFERIRHASAGASDPAVYRFAAELAASFPPEALHPPRLATGDDLVAMGAPPGPVFSRALEQLETAQLEGQVTTREEALTLLRRVAAAAQR